MPGREIRGSPEMTIVVMSIQAGRDFLLGELTVFFQAHFHPETGSKVPPASPANSLARAHLLP